jgi:hypothetical protein
MKLRIGVILGTLITAPLALLLGLLAAIMVRNSDFGLLPTWIISIAVVVIFIAGSYRAMKKFDMAQSQDRTSIGQIKKHYLVASLFVLFVGVCVCFSSAVITSRFWCLDNFNMKDCASAIVGMDPWVEKQRKTAEGVKLAFASPQKKALDAFLASNPPYPCPGIGEGLERCVIDWIIAKNAVTEIPLPVFETITSGTDEQIRQELAILRFAPNRKENSFPSYQIPLLLMTLEEFEEAEKIIRSTYRHAVDKDMFRTLDDPLSEIIVTLANAGRVEEAIAIVKLLPDWKKYKKTLDLAAIPKGTAISRTGLPQPDPVRYIAATLDRMGEKKRAYAFACLNDELFQKVECGKKTQGELPAEMLFDVGPVSVFALDSISPAQLPTVTNLALISWLSRALDSGDKKKIRAGINEVSKRHTAWRQNPSAQSFYETFPYQFGPLGMLQIIKNPQLHEFLPSLWRFALAGCAYRRGGFGFYPATLERLPRITEEEIYALCVAESLGGGSRGSLKGAFYFRKK